MTQLYREICELLTRNGGVFCASQDDDRQWVIHVTKGKTQLRRAAMLIAVAEFLEACLGPGSITLLTPESMTFSSPVPDGVFKGTCLTAELLSALPESELPPTKRLYASNGSAVLTPDEDRAKAVKCLFESMGYECQAGRDQWSGLYFVRWKMAQILDPEREDYLAELTQGDRVRFSATAAPDFVLDAVFDGWNDDDATIMDLINIGNEPSNWSRSNIAELLFWR